MVYQVSTVPVGALRPIDIKRDYSRMWIAAGKRVLLWWMSLIIVVNNLGKCVHLSLIGTQGMS